MAARIEKVDSSTPALRKCHGALILEIRRYVIVARMGIGYEAGTQLTQLVYDMNLPRFGRTLLPFVCLAMFPGVAQSQEFSALGGVLRSYDPGDTNYPWAFSYLQTVAGHDALSFTWLNEGNIPNNHRDGFSFQYWRQYQLPGKRLSLAAGIGPYLYFNTTGQGHQDDHGVGAMLSISATWYFGKHLFTLARVNEIFAPGSFNSTSVMVGVGYTLDTSPGAGPFRAGSSDRATSGDQLLVMMGRTTINNATTPSATAKGIEYRRGLGPYLDASISYIDEGPTTLSIRRGFAVQGWLRRSFLDDRLSLAIGSGPYVTLAHNQTDKGTGSDVSLLFTMSAAWQLDRHWFVRASWNRVMTGYDRDSDVFMGGIGYRM